MTQHAVVRGFARWYGKRIIPALVPFSFQRVTQIGFVTLAEKTPDIALMAIGNMLGPGVGGMLAQFLSLAVSDEAFDAVASGMQEALTKEHVKFAVPDAQGPHGFEIDGEEFAVLLAEIKAADVECARPQTGLPPQQMMNQNAAAPQQHPAVVPGMAANGNGGMRQ